MRKITSFLFLCLMLLGIAIPQDALATQADVNTILSSGGFFRLKNRGSSRYMTENYISHGLTGMNKITTADSLRQIWILHPMGGGAFRLRNAYTGRYINTTDGNPIVTVPEASIYYIKYSAMNTTSSSFVTISWAPDFSGNKCLNQNFSSSNILGWKANAPGQVDNYSDWSFERVNGLTEATIRTQIDKYLKAVTPTNGQYVRIANVAYGTVISESMSSKTLSCFPESATDYTQVWQVLQTTNGNWQFKNVVTDRIIVKQNGATSTQYTTTAPSSSAFILGNGLDAYITDYVIGDGSTNVGLHCDRQGKVVGWYNDAPTTNWIFKTATIDQEALNAQREESQAQAFYQLGYNVLRARTSLRNLFKDDACTVLKDEIQALSNDSLVRLMSKVTTGYTTVALPQNLQDIVLKVKNNTWGKWEKEFRIHSYNAYSNHNVWNGQNYIYSGYPFSPQTNPTGISVKRGRSLLVFLGADVPAGATINLMITPGQDVNGTSTPLVRGLNYVPVSDDGHAFVSYTITSPNSKLVDFDTIPVHIEGGYVNGVFDITRGHKNADWLKMLEDGLFTDEVTHLKSKYIQFNMLTKGLKGINPTEQFTQIDTDGTPKALEGVLLRWDQIIERTRSVMGIEKFAPYFNCMFSASSSSQGNPYATSWGTYYPGVGDYMSYNGITFGWENNEGANLWVIAHENGHLHQNAINLAGDTEVSVNFFSQFCTWLQGSNVGRGRPWSNTANSFHKGQFYHNYDLWQRSRMYFQLWLYFHEMRHKTDFYPKLFEKLRQDPLLRSGDRNNPYSGTVNFLKFAKYACDAAEEDLSEFFQFYGFFVPLNNYEVGDYSNSYFTTTQADIDAAIAYMKKYPKANKSLMFIDERIRKSPAIHPGASAGQMRFGTSPDASPGVASEVGEVGMYSDFVDNPEYQPYTFTVSETGRVSINASSGRGAVGFKVYDANGKFVYAANTYNFTVPSQYLASGYTIMVALGDGTQRPLDSNVTGIDNATVEAPSTEKVYDLTGRQTQVGAKGVYIINGKRVIR
ncbi:MAG: M60 family metallopeptidase [Alloprevotella sp.]|nr:M60 family metallopeptidase [Bacteroidales bacterium]MDY3943265.1 M60 family metallopeptidase [Alloprevotella sp.]